MKNVPSVGFEFFSAHILYMINLEQSPPPKKIDMSMKVLLLIFFFFFFDCEHSSPHPKLLACGLVVFRSSDPVGCRHSH